MALAASDIVAKYLNWEEVVSNRVKRASLTRQVQERLDLMRDAGIGVSKHKEKQANPDGHPDRDKIHSYRTYEAYLDKSVHFVQWAKERYGCRHLDECREHVPEYLQERMQTMSPSTVALDTSALAKLYGCSKADFGVALPKRERGGFVKNRGDKWAGHYSRETHAELDQLCAGTGMRRCEIPRVAPEQVVVREDGQTWIENVKGKGGKIRDIPVIPEHAAFVQGLADQARAAGNRQLYSGPIPKRAPIHADRGQRYAQALYQMHARPIGEIPKSEQYICRKDMKGQIYDKRAMAIVTRALGHTRLNVLTNYFR